MASGNATEFSMLADELSAVAQAAGDRLRAEADADTTGAGQAAENLMTAATAAMAAGHSLGDITQAEALGQKSVRELLRPEALRDVEQSGRRAREARAEHHQAIGRATRLGLSAREIAAAAGVTHGTVRAISNRQSATGNRRRTDNSAAGRGASSASRTG